MNLETRSFDYTPKDFKLLVALKDSLYPAHLKGLSSVEACQHDFKSTPDYCKFQLNFILSENNVVGWESTQHDDWDFDKALLDSTLCLPKDQKFWDLSVSCLESQISRAKEMGIKVLHAWSLEGGSWSEELYAGKGFEVSLREYQSLLLLDELDFDSLGSKLSQFDELTYKILALDELKKTNRDWEKKLFDLWMAIEEDVPTDFPHSTVSFDLWRSSVLSPCFLPEDCYVVVHQNKWVALSSYERSSRTEETISTELSGVLPEYRRQGLCTAVKIFSLKDLRQKKFRRVVTENEENNPMFTINQSLGFKKVGEELAFKRSL
jgi:hypothetical protein